VLDCQCYIEMVASGAGSEAGESPWSSAAHHLGSRHDPLVTPHRAVWALGNTLRAGGGLPGASRAGLPAATRQAIEQAMRSGLLLGDESARRALERELHRSLAPAPGAPAGFGGQAANRLWH
jgi:putative transposase